MEKNWPGQLYPLFPRISQKAFGIIKMVEKVVQANFFHHFREKIKLPQKFVAKVEKVVLANFFHDPSRFGGTNRGKSWPEQLFPLFPRISGDVFGIIKMVEKIVQANFFSPFSCKIKLPQKSVEKVEKVVLANFFHDSSRFGGPNRGKSWPGQLFPPFL